MTRTELIDEIKESLQIDEELTLDMNLDEIEEWDSLAAISIITLYDELFSTLLTNEQLNDCVNIDDLVSLVSDKLA